MRCPRKRHINGRPPAPGLFAAFRRFDPALAGEYIFHVHAGLFQGLIAQMGVDVRRSLIVRVADDSSYDDRIFLFYGLLLR